MERKYLKLSGDYQGEGTHTLLEIGNAKQSYPAGDLPKWKYLRSLGKSEMEHPRLFGEAKEKYPRLSGEIQESGEKHPSSDEEQEQSTLC